MKDGGGTVPGSVFNSYRRRIHAKRACVYGVMLVWDVLENSGTLTAVCGGT